MKKKLIHQGVSVDVAELPANPEGVFMVIDSGMLCEEVVTITGVELPVVDYKTNKVIKPGKLLGVTVNR